jgi:hypothetical protein
MPGKACTTALLCGQRLEALSVVMGNPITGLEGLAPFKQSGTNRSRR